MAKRPGITVKSSINEELFQNTYNCDSNEPTPLVDTGWIRDPIKEFEFEIKKYLKPIVES